MYNKERSDESLQIPLFSRFDISIKYTLNLYLLYLYLSYFSSFSFVVYSANFFNSIIPPLNSLFSSNSLFNSFQLKLSFHF